MDVGLGRHAQACTGAAARLRKLADEAEVALATHEIAMHELFSEGHKPLQELDDVLTALNKTRARFHKESFQHGQLEEQVKSCEHMEAGNEDVIKLGHVFATKTEELKASEMEYRTLVTAANGFLETFQQASATHLVYVDVHSTVYWAPWCAGRDAAARAALPRVAERARGGHTHGALRLHGCTGTHIHCRR